MKAVIVEPEAEKDIAEAKNYYHKINASLAARFTKEVNDHFKLLGRNPEAFPEVYKNYRRMLLNRFPYAVFYIYEDACIRVLAVFHQKRNIERLIKER